jgi:dTMP kinase
MFITLEGSEGCGKTSQQVELVAFLRQLGYQVLATREPGGTPIGNQIRSVITSLQNTGMQPRTEILLFQASRAQLVEDVIKPHLASGGIVICDRYGDSTLAYQGYGYQSELEPLRQLVEFATGGLTPDLTILLDLDIEIGLMRRAQAGGKNRLDNYDLDFYQRVRQGYLDLTRQEPERWVVIDASGDFNEVQQAIRQVVLDRLSQKPV